MKGYYALNACALALNSSAVLVVGLIKALDFSASWSKEDDGLFPNTETSIYNFETKRWILQESIHYNTSEGSTLLLQEPIHFNLFPPQKFVYSYACQIVPDKKWNRYTHSSFMTKSEKSFKIAKLQNFGSVSFLDKSVYNMANSSCLDICN